MIFDKMSSIAEFLIQLCNSIQYSRLLEIKLLKNLVNQCDSLISGIAIEWNNICKRETYYWLQTQYLKLQKIPFNLQHYLPVSIICTHYLYKLLEKSFVMFIILYKSTISIYITFVFKFMIDTSIDAFLCVLCVAVNWSCSNIQLLIWDQIRLETQLQRTIYLDIDLVEVF